MMERRAEFLADVLTVGVEGGIGYWARIVDSKRDDNLNWTEIVVVEYESAIVDLDLGRMSYDDLDARVDAGDPRLAEYVHLVTLEDMERAIKAHRDAPLVNSEMRATMILADVEEDACHLDAYDADAIVQVAAFGEVVYG